MYVCMYFSKPGSRRSSGRRLEPIEPPAGRDRAHTHTQKKKKKGTQTRQSFCVFQKIRPCGRARSCQRAMISPPSPPPLLFVFPGMECDCDFPGQNLSACTSDASMASSIRRRSCREEDPGKGAPSLRRPPPLHLVTDRICDPAQDLRQGMYTTHPPL